MVVVMTGFLAQELIHVLRKMAEMLKMLVISFQHVIHQQLAAAEVSLLVGCKVKLHLIQVRLIAQQLLIVRVLQPES